MVQLVDSIVSNIGIDSHLGLTVHDDTFCNKLLGVDDDDIDCEEQAVKFDSLVLVAGSSSLDDCS